MVEYAKYGYYETPLGVLTKRQIVARIPYPDNLLYCVLSPEEFAERVENLKTNQRDITATLDYVLGMLSEREKRVILMRFKEKRTLEQCASEFGVRRERIRQIEAQALRKLRHPSRVKYLVKGVVGCSDLSYQAGFDKGVRKGHDQAVCESEAGEKPVQAERAFHNHAISELGLSTRAYNVLVRANITDTYQIATMTCQQISKLRNCGKKTMDEICSVIKNECGIEIPTE